MNARQPLTVEVDRGGLGVFLKVTPRGRRQVRHRRRRALSRRGQERGAAHRHGRLGLARGARGPQARRRDRLGRGPRDPRLPGRDPRQVRRRRHERRAGPVPDHVPPRRQAGRRDGLAAQGRRRVEGRRSGRPGSSRGGRAVSPRPGLRRGLAPRGHGFPDDVLRSRAALPRPGEHEDDVGSARHREVLRRGGAHRRRSARRAHGGDLAAARDLQPAADPRARRRPPLPAHDRRACGATSRCG